MRVLRVFRSLLCCGAAGHYASVRVDEDDPHSCDLTPLPKGLRRRVVTSLKEGEAVWYFERHFHVAAFLGYLLLGLLPVALWGYLLGMHIVQGSAVREELWLLIAGCCLAVLCAVMALNSSRICSTCLAFTSRRMMWVAGNGPMRWILMDHVEPPASAERGVAKFRVTGGGDGAAPLHELCFQSVPDVGLLDGLVFAEAWRRRHPEAPAPAAAPPPDGAEVPGIGGRPLTPAVAAQIQQLLRPGERLLWAHQPYGHQVALFSVPLLLVCLTSLPLLFFSSAPDGAEDAVSLWPPLLSLAGVAVSVALAVWECLSCRVVYFLTTHSLAVLYLHSALALAFPLDQLRSVGLWPEGGRGGSATFTFRCDATSAECLPAQRRLGPLATRHVKPVAESSWFLTVRDWERLSEAALGRRLVPMPTLPADPSPGGCGDPDDEC